MTDAHIGKILTPIRAERIWISSPIWLALKRLWKMTNIPRYVIPEEEEVEPLTEIVQD